MNLEKHNTQSFCYMITILTVQLSNTNACNELFFFSSLFLTKTLKNLNKMADGMSKPIDEILQSEKEAIFTIYILCMTLVVKLYIVQYWSAIRVCTDTRHYKT